MTWTAGTPQPVVKGIGVLELLGALGLILPALTGILPWLTPLAAVGLGLTMVGAALTNLHTGKPRHLIANAVLLIATTFVAYGRFVGLPV